jgi:hypothetical protein
MAVDFFWYACFSLEIINGYQDGFLMVSTGMVALAFMEWGDRGAVWLCHSLRDSRSLKQRCCSFVDFGLLLVCLQVVALADGAWESSGWTRVVRGRLGFVVILALWPWLQLQNGIDPTNVQGACFGLARSESRESGRPGFPRFSGKSVGIMRSVPGLLFPS